MLTNFEKVQEFNASFEAEISPVLDCAIFDTNPSLVQRRLDLITEEYEELLQAVKDKNMAEVIDALCDLEYLVLGMADVLDVPFDEAFHIVHDSNMTKLCKDEAEAIATVAKYKTESRYKDPAYRPTKYGKAYIVYDRETGKVLKSINYTPADFTSILEKAV